MEKNSFFVTFFSHLTESGGPAIPIEFTVDSNGIITSFTGLSGPVSGMMFVEGEKVSAFIYTGEEKPYSDIQLLGDISGNTITGQYAINNGGEADGTIALERSPMIFDVTGYWDLYVPVISERKIDAFYFFDSYPDFYGVTIFGAPFSGTISGQDMTFSDYKDGLFTGTIDNDEISGVFTQSGTNYQLTLEPSSFYLTNLYPGEMLNSLTPVFSWSESVGADKFFIRISKDNDLGTCDEDQSCVAVWEMANITDHQVVFNADSSAWESLSPDENYRVRVYSQTSDQTGVPDQADENTYVYSAEIN